MHIANPIYDVVFKYLLEDNKVAKLFLSAIIGEHITELDFSAQERTLEIQPPKKEHPPLTVCRFDFSAKIETEAGFKTISIELQKAKFLSDLMRFRRYLGLHYQSSGNTYAGSVQRNDDENQEAQGKAKDQGNPRQIYCIYFLGYGMDLPSCPVLKVDYKVHDVYSGAEFPATGEFVSSLHHRSWIVQINMLKEHRRNNLEKLLTVFDQSSQTDLKYILDVDDESFPAEYRAIMRRLRKAMEDPDKRREMELEEEIVSELQERERQIDEANKAVERAHLKISEQGNIIAGQGNTIAILQSDNETLQKTIADLKRKLGLSDER